MRTRWASVEVDRAAPWARDPSFSSKGHEPRVSSGLIDPDEVEAWIATHAPEFTKPGVNEYVEQIDEGRTLRILSTRDERGYGCAAYIHTRIG